MANAHRGLARRTCGYRAAMEERIARWLVSAEGQDALAVAAGQDDPSSLSSAEALRFRWPAEQAAAALTQEVLRRRAVTKFGPAARALYFTPDGLEQATRPAVARWRAERLVTAGAAEVLDLGCGIGSDALAFVDHGLELVAIEADPATAVLAQANLGARGRVVLADVEEVALDLLGPGTAVFADPARRTANGRSWRVEDFRPRWGFVTGLLSGDRVACVKAGPGLPSQLIPEQAAAVWVSHRGDLVETSLWAGSPDWAPGSRTAVLLPEGIELRVEAGRLPDVGPVARYLYEPDPAVIRAGGLAQVAELVSGHAVATGIAYLTSDVLHRTPFATCFEVLDTMPYDERDLRHWVRQAGIGSLEIKVRGLDVDPAVMRRRLKPKGRAAATVILTPTRGGARALVARRVALAQR